jgi:hypothetical protein
MRDMAAVAAAHSEALAELSRRIAAHIRERVPELAPQPD